MSLRSFLKGWAGEAMGVAAQWAFLDGAVYTSLNNVTLQTANGTTQIDHVVISRYGIFVIEAKNVEGWIFGDAKSPQWTIVKPGRKFRMQNPLHQNYRHTKAIQEFLGVDESKIHSMVMFWGECELKTDMPPNVMAKGYATYIKGFSKPLFTDDEVVEVVEALRSGALPKTWATRKTHLASLEARHTSTTTCARCGSPLVLRTVRGGAKAGSQFYGCSGYPKCRHTVPYSGETQLS